MNLPRNLHNWSLINLFQTYFWTNKKDLKEFIYIEICIRANDKK